MNEEFGDPVTLRHYHLGTLHDDILRSEIEKRLITNDGFAESVSVAENDLIEDYLDGELSADEAECFERHFLISRERKQQLRLTENLRKLATKYTILPLAKRGLRDWVFGPSMRWPRFAVSALLIVVAILGFWRFAIFRSDADKGLAELRKAYQGQRLMESRISALPDYAPMDVTRGASQTVPDTDAHDRADRYLRDATHDSNDGKAHHALALLYLADKRYDSALREFEKALAASSKDASLESDVGAAYFEMARQEISKTPGGDKNGAKVLEFLDNSLHHVDLAISLAPRMLEPRFNRALCLALLGVSEQAKTAWREYLELDPDSPWADEARRNLQALESQDGQERSSEEVEADFLQAYRMKNQQQAWTLLSQNRELIREKYLPQRLAISYVSASAGEKETLKQALLFAGDLELKNIGDPFAGEIARFYSGVTGNNLEKLRLAHDAVRNGYAACLSSQYPAALAQFTTAQDLFRQAGNKWEAALSEYFIGYCLFNTDRKTEATRQFEKVAAFASAGKYKWLKATILYWLGNGYGSSKQGTLAKNTYEQGLAIADEINDSYSIQRNLSALAEYYSRVGQFGAALRYQRRNLELSNRVGTSLRQKYRNYSYASEILFDARFTSASKVIAVESVAIADRLKDLMFETLSRCNAGLTSSQIGNFDEARNWITAAKERADKIADESSRNRMAAYSLLADGYLENKAGDFERSERAYDEAATLYATLQMPSQMYVAQKGKLLAYEALGKNQDLETQIPITLKLGEDFRDKIFEEKERTSYFDLQKSIYDIAVEYESRRGETEKAYDYAESSSARSLLDWLQNGANVNADSANVKVLLKENSVPLGLAAIRAKIPENVQILQYAVLEDRVLIWLISNERVSFAQTVINSRTLLDKVNSYRETLIKHDRSSAADLGKAGMELSGLLIGPVRGELDPSKEICIIPSKFLFDLPFATLLSPSGQPLVKDFAIVYAPSANIFLICTENARNRANSPRETLLSIGNPSLDQKETNLPDLADADDEAREIAAFYSDPKTLTGKRATKTAVLLSMKDAEVIHFAGHYVVDHDDPMSSHLVLAAAANQPGDDKLSNAELAAESGSKAKLIVLSACQTGIESYYEGEGMIGLSRTFVAVGVPLVVASQWDVESEATKALMTRFHFFRRQRNLSTVAALRSAQLEMSEDSNGRFRDPYYWAGFAVFGGYATF